MEKIMETTMSFGVDGSGVAATFLETAKKEFYAEFSSRCPSARRNMNRCSLQA